MIAVNKVFISSNSFNVNALKMITFVRLFSLAILTVFLFSSVGNAGSYTNYIADKCPKEFRSHQETVKEFAIRMKPFVEKCGCGVVNLYYALGNSNLVLVSSLENDIDLMSSAAKVFEISHDFTDAMKQSPDVVETLTLIANRDPNMFHKLSEVLSSFSRYDGRQLRKDPSYILYYILAAAMAEEKATTSDLKLTVRNLKRNVSLDAVSALTLLYLQTMIVYPEADPNYWMSAAKWTLECLGTQTVNSLSPYKEYLALFLPPNEDDIPESQNLSDREMQRLKQDYISLMEFVFNLINRTSESAAYALKVTEHISPYLLEALRFHRNKTQIKQYLNYELRSDNFGLVLKDGICQSGVGDAGLQNFFIMYSPYDNGHPVPGTEGNLGLIAKWFEEGTLERYISNQRDINGYVYTMSLLPRIYLGLTKEKQKRVFNDLLLNLSENPNLNGRVIIALYETTEFFSWVQYSPDAFSKVIHNEDVKFGYSAEKYKYILLTSYPKDDSSSILYSFNGKLISSSALNHLMYMSIEELESHNFTDNERYTEMAENFVDIADWTVTVVSIAAVPFTAGASAGVAAMMLARKGAISAAKRTIKTLSKKSLKSATKLIGQKGWKAAKREGKEVMGWATKRGRKSVREEAIKKGIQTTDKWYIRFEYIRVGGAVASGAMAYFLAKSMNHSGYTDLCTELQELKMVE
jgi:hypothetical protein